MKDKSVSNIRSIFFIILILELIGEALAHIKTSYTLIYLVKPLLMPALMVYYYKSIEVAKGKSNAIHRLILAALFFSFLGDVFLMLTWSGGNLFLVGLVAFLIAHICYIFVFTKNLNTSKPSIIKQKGYSALPILVYVVLLVALLFNFGNAEFHEMKVPVIIYATVIMLMAIAAFNRYDRVFYESFKLVLLGAILFVFSDSVIALNKFTSIFENTGILPRILIMATYATGQYLIVEGMIVQSKSIQD